MKTNNPFRKKKVDEIRRTWDLYPDLDLHERLFKVLHYLVEKAVQRDDHTELGSVQEMAAVMEPLFLNPRTGKPNADAINWINKVITRVRKDKGHPHVRPFTMPHVEVTADGIEVVRNYLDLLRGRLAVIKVNDRLEKQITGIRESQATNRDLINVKQVMKEAERWASDLEYKQQEATDRKRRRRK